MQIIEQPYITRTGRNNYLKIERSPQYLMVNCIYPSLAVQNICQSMKNQTAHKIKQLSLYFLERAYLQYAVKRQETLIIKMSLLDTSTQSDPILISSHQDLKCWLRYQKPPYTSTSFFEFIEFHLSCYVIKRCI